jgi:hypothetical protein
MVDLVVVVLEKLRSIQHRQRLRSMLLRQTASVVRGAARGQKPPLRRSSQRPLRMTLGTMRMNKGKPIKGLPAFGGMQITKFSFD